MVLEDSVYYYTLFCIMTSLLAYKRGRRWWLWLIIAITISPLASILFLFCMKNLSDRIDMNITIETKDETNDNKSN